jgi:hypothetical protein
MDEKTPKATLKKIKEHIYGVESQGLLNWEDK